MARAVRIHTPHRKHRLDRRLHLLVQAQRRHSARPTPHVSQERSATGSTCTLVWMDVFRNLPLLSRFIVRFLLHRTRPLKSLTKLFHTSLREIRGFTHPLSIAAQMSPLSVGGAAAALALIWMIPRVKPHWIFAISKMCFFLGDLLVALAPVNQSYWAMIFPAVILVNP